VAIWVIFLALILATYLLVAYVAGELLSRPQATIITGVMLWFSFISISHIYAGLQTLIELRELAFFGYTFLRKATVFKWLATIGCTVAPLVCIKFMYHVRHPRFAAPVRPTTSQRNHVTTPMTKEPTESPGQLADVDNR
jgi:hypothetical protein